jgi:Fe-S cluster biogenesis protein NfuA
VSNKFDLIDETINDYINPGLAIHSGSVEIFSCDLEVTPPVLKLKFDGMCGECPSSFSQTLETVASFLREETGITDLVVDNVTEKPENFNMKYVFSPDEEDE